MIRLTRLQLPEATLTYIGQIEKKDPEKIPPRKYYRWELFCDGEPILEGETLHAIRTPELLESLRKEYQHLLKIAAAILGCSYEEAKAISMANGIPSPDNDLCGDSVRTMVEEMDRLRYQSQQEENDEDK